MNSRYLTVNGVHWHRTVAEKKIGRKLKKGEVVHHINGDPRDNRPSNLQVCGSIKEHLAIHHRTDLRTGKWRRKGSTSKYPGVHFCKRTGLWRAMMSINNKSKHIGRFKTEALAHEAYQAAADDLTA